MLSPEQGAALVEVSHLMLGIILVFGGWLWLVTREKQGD